MLRSEVLQEQSASIDIISGATYASQSYAQSVESALQQVRDRDLLTTHAFWTVFHGILGTGLDNTTLTDPATKKKVNAIAEFVPNAYSLTKPQSNRPASIARALVQPHRGQDRIDDSQGF